MQQRGSDRLSPLRDDEMKHELEGMLRSDHATRAEEWRDPEPSAEDDPEPDLGPPPEPGSPRAREERDEEFRFDLARHLRRTVFPAAREDLLRLLDETHGPGYLTEAVRQLPPDVRYDNVQHVARALGRQPRA